MKIEIYNRHGMFIMKLGGKSHQFVLGFIEALKICPTWMVQTVISEGECPSKCANQDLACSECLGMSNFKELIS
jgi:hypothetical protein